MNILYIGAYRQLDGWGQASRLFIQALQKTGHNISIRPITMGVVNMIDSLPAAMLALEKAVYPKYDMVIQNVLPQLMEYDASFGKNVGMFFSETGNLQTTGWPTRCNLMDEIWVSSEAEKQNLYSSGVTKHIKKVHIPADTTRYEKGYTPLDIPGQDFKFYFMGENIQRKSMITLIIAFHLEFHTNEPVSLVIKTSHGGVHPAAHRQQLEQEIIDIKKAYRVYQRPEAYSKEVLITEYLSEEDMCRLHTTCDCFVMPSHGEAWSIPAFDAMAFGNTPIVTAGTGMEEFIDEETGWAVRSNQAPVLAVDPPMQFLYTAHETWRNIDIAELRRAMREAYTNRHKKREAGLNRAFDFSFSKIAEQINAD